MRKLATRAQGITASTSRSLQSILGNQLLSDITAEDVADLQNTRKDGGAQDGKSMPRLARFERSCAITAASHTFSAGSRYYLKAQMLDARWAEKIDP